MSRTPARTRRLVLLLLFAAACAGGAAWWAWKYRAAAPPVVDTGGLDPEAARAVEEAHQEVRLTPRSASAWGHLGMVLRAHSLGAEANACFQEAERLDPAEPRWPYYRGLTLVLTDPPAGITCLRRAAERLGDGPAAPAFRLAEVLIEQGQLDEAGRLLDGANRGADRLRGELLRARLAAAREDWKAALALAEGCLQDLRTTRQAHLLAADACRRLGDLGRARKLIDQARSLPDDAPWHDPLVAEVERLQVGLGARLAMASALEREGRPEEAAALVERALRDRPRDANAWMVLGQMLRRMGRLDQAEQALDRAVRADPDHVEGWFSLGVVRVFQGRKQPAADAFRQAVRLKPDHVLACHNLAICLKDTGDIEGARRAWRDALRIQPDYAPAREGLENLAKPAPK
jgi:tetratricopeptide (TPR) repeat protein